MIDIKYSCPTDDDLPAVRSLLDSCGLLTGGIELVSQNCLVAEVDSRLVATVALEPCGRCALLRSLAVAPDFRGRSLGRGLCARIISHARLLGLERLYLLTMDAEEYFTAQGFMRMARSKAPAEIQATSQFRSLCPESAVCMVRNITGEVIHASRELLNLRPDVPGARMWAVSLEHTMLTYFEVEPHSRFESHSHVSEQITMVFSGELFFEAQGAVHCIRAGEVIGIPSRVPHAVWTEEAAVIAVDAWSPVLKKYKSGGE